jgi:hypothetical protein
MWFYGIDCPFPFWMLAVSGKKCRKWGTIIIFALLFAMVCAPARSLQQL